MGATSEIAIVYQARNLVNGHRYIGFTCQGLAVREKQHRYDARKGKPYRFHRAIAKYGDENFVFELLADFDGDRELALLYEREAVEKYQPEYNLMLGGDAHIPSLETRAKIAAGHRGKKYPNRPPHSEERRKRQSESMKGKASAWMTGRKASPETRAKLSAVRIGHPNYNTKPITEETRAKLRIANRGRVPVNKGGHHTPEVIERMREAQKRSYINPSPQRIAAQKANAKARSNVLRKPVECVTDGNKFESIAAAARFYGVTKAYLANVVKGRFPPMRGLTFRYLDEQPE